MTQTLKDWLDALRAKRRVWVQANLDNDFDRGIWNATVAKYADPSHFVFELIQNAEDARASEAKFILDRDAITFEHNGRPFSREDIVGITGIGNTTKLEAENKIGCFGIGFKSVYVVTPRPEIHCTIEGMPIAFAITDLVVPELIDTDYAKNGTRIVLRLPPDKAEATIKAVREILDSDGPRCLLFLRTLRQLEWGDLSAPAWCAVKDGADGIRALQSRAGQELIASERFIVLERPVEEQFEHRPEQDEPPRASRLHTVKIALKLNDGGDVVPEPETTRLSVFFETEEPTGLRFRVHGPFQLTDNRANIKKQDPWNARLIDEIAALMAESLPALRDRGLVKRSFLEVMPNREDSLPAHWRPVLDRVTETFRKEALLPAQSDGHVAAQAGVRGLAEIRDLLGDDGLAAFGGLPGKRWVVSGLRNSRIDAFHATLEVSEWTLQDFVRRVRSVFAPTYGTVPIASIAASQSWFDGLTDEQVQRFYLLADGAVRPLKHWGTLTGLKCVRIADGTRRMAHEARLLPQDAQPDEGSSAHLALVRPTLVRGGRGRGKDVEDFLQKIGVEYVTESDHIAGALAVYQVDAERLPSADLHVRQMRLFLSYYERTKDAKPFANVPFLRAEGVDGYHKPLSIYFGPQFSSNGLHRIYGGQVKGRDRLPLWSGYGRLKRTELLALLKLLGVEDTLTVNTMQVTAAHPRYRTLCNFGSARPTASGISVDYFIPQLEGIIALRDPEISRMIWNAVAGVGRVCMFASYAPNQRYTPHQDLSNLAFRLRDLAWIPAKDGTLRKLADIGAADLADGLSAEGNMAWLNVLDFEASDRKRAEHVQAARRAAEAIGLSEELLVQLSRLDPEARKSLGEQMLRLIESGALRPPEFPEQTSNNPERRAQRLAEQAATAPLRTYEDRTRSVRTSDRDARQMARPYLRSLYTNDAGEMICQACHDRMPFRLADGTPYFEAPELIRALETEHAANHLVLCPTCCAKWQYANGTSDQDILGALQNASSPAISAELARQTVLIRFVQVHFDDLRTILEVANRPAPSPGPQSGPELVTVGAQ
jgi:hypothetical protein